METKIQVVKERSGGEYSKEGMRMCCIYRKSRRGSLKPAAPSCGGSGEATTTAVFTALTKYLHFVLLLVQSLTHCLACKNSISKLSLRCQSEYNPLQFMQFTFKNRQDGPVRQLTGQRNGRVAARDKNKKAKSNFGNLFCRKGHVLKTS